MGRRTDRGAPPPESRGACRRLRGRHGNRRAMTGALDDLAGFRAVRARRIQQLSQRRSWDAGTAVDWTQLSFERVPRPVRAAMTELYGDILLAESLGVKGAVKMAQ